MILDRDLSDLIGAIYECAIDPEKWSEVLWRISEASRSSGVMIQSITLDGSEMRFIQQVGFTPDNLANFRPEYSRQTANYFRMAFANPNNDINRPFVLSRVVPKEIREQDSVYVNWAAPQGLVDSMAAVLLMTNNRVVSAMLVRHSRDGLIDDASIELISLLMPHLRRSFLISDLVDQQRVTAGALRLSLDALPSAVIIVDGRGGILEANATARGLLDKGNVIRAEGNRLMASPDLTPRLHAAFAAAANGEPSDMLDSRGLKLDDAERGAVAHILPLASVGASEAFGSSSLVGVFIGGARLAPPQALEAVAIAHGLTPAEARFLRAIAQGESVAEASAVLGISTATGRTHLKRIFAKFGVHRHSELVGLLRKIAPPYLLQ